jgi:hypothetical protein
MTLVAASLGFAVVQLDGASLAGGVSDLQWVVAAYTVALRRSS